MSPLGMTMDALLLMTTVVAMTYCWKLARRLRDLHTLESGVGEAIVSLTRQIKQSQAAHREMSETVKSSLDELNAALDRVKEQQQAADDMLEVLDGQVARAKGRLSQTIKSSDEIAERLGKLTERARLELKALTKGVEIASRVNSLIRETPIPRPRPQERDASVQRLHQAAADIAPPTRNPFKNVKAG